jgi:putative RecB family exonuclease
LEQLFDLPARDRTLEHAHNLFRKEWSQIRQDHLDLFTEVMTEREWGLQGLKLLENYMQVENPMQMQPPAQREVWVQAKLTMNDADDEEDPILVRGIVDRLDLVRTATSTASPRNGPSSVSFAITDYKTGKAPELKYSAACNQRIRQEAFFQLQIYAMLLQEMRNNKKKKSSDSAAAMESLPVTQLRLLYLTSVSGQAVSWEDAVPDLLEVKEQVLGVWKEMRQMIDAQDPTVFHGCNRSFCYCHKCRDLFVPGSVWEPKR